MEDAFVEGSFGTFYHGTAKGFEDCNTTNLERELKQKHQRIFSGVF